MANTPARPPLRDLQGSVGINMDDPETAKLLEQLLRARNAHNAASASQNSQPAVLDKRGKQLGSTRAVWTREEERFMAELKLAEADKERAERPAKGHKKTGKMVSSTVSTYLSHCCCQVVH